MINKIISIVLLFSTLLCSLTLFSCHKRANIDEFVVPDNFDTSKQYGVNWFVPKRLPTEAVDAPIQVSVLAVLRGTQAEKDGIKRGQIVKSINGVAIKTRKDMAPFLDGSVAATKVEVDDAK